MVRKRDFLRHLHIEMIVLPRQARDKHRENSKRTRFCREGNQTDPFQLVDGKYQYGDATLWSDPDTGKGYVYWRARTPQDGAK